MGQKPPKADQNGSLRSEDFAPVPIVQRIVIIEHHCK